jgi:SAM-dependent methyltransferase
MGIRYRIQTQVLEPLQDRFDRLGPLPYQPLPGATGRPAKREQASRDRWEAIEGFLGERRVAPGAAMDVGCNIGFFCFALAARGVPTLGVEMDPRYFRIASHGRARRPGDPVWFLNMAVTDQTLPLLPVVDLTLLLAVWHHWVRHEGLDGASALLAGVWSHTDRALLFETGEREMGPAFGLPAFDPDPATWLADYLARTCEGSEVAVLGRYPATESSGSGDAPLRNLFAVVRREPRD